MSSPAACRSAGELTLREQLERGLLTTYFLGHVAAMCGTAPQSRENTRCGRCAREQDTVAGVDNGGGRRQVAVAAHPPTATRGTCAVSACGGVPRSAEFEGFPGEDQIHILDRAPLGDRIGYARVVHRRPGPPTAARHPERRELPKDLHRHRHRNQSRPSAVERLPGRPAPRRHLQYGRFAIPPAASTAAA